VVWFQYHAKKSLIHKNVKIKFVKKFQRDGTPDESYFGPGMYANYLYEPDSQDTKVYEIYPDPAKKADLAYLATNIPRSFEIYKPKGADHSRLAIRSATNDIDSYARSTNADYAEIDEPDLKEDCKDCTYRFFDFELFHQFNFTSLENGQTPIIDRLIRSMLSVKDCGLLLQFLFTKSFEWNEIAEKTAQNLSRYLKDAEQLQSGTVFTGFDRHFFPRLSSRQTPKINEISSSKYQAAKMLEKIYHKKSGSPLITLAIRGAAFGKNADIENALENIAAVFSSVGLVCDSLQCFTYDVGTAKAQSWLKNNIVTSTYAVEILQNNCNMWSDMRWGRGRDFVPFLCLTADELSFFVSFPSDLSIPISYGRKKVRGQNYEKYGFEIGNTV
jgi:hypothetical protein